MNANKLKSAQLKMIDSVLGIFKTKDAVLDQRPAVKKDIAELKSCREEIAKQLKFVKPSAQHASNRDVCREKLRGYCMEYAPYLVRLGRDMEGDFLVDTFSSPSKMCKKESSMIAFAGSLIEQLTENLEDLADVGITQEKIDAINDSLEDLGGMNEAGDLQNKTNANFSIEADKQLTKALSTMREKLDISMNSLRDLDIELFNLYQLARVMSKLSQKSTQLVITINEAGTDRLIVNATASVPFLKETFISNSEGIIIIKTGKNKEFEVTVTKPNYSVEHFYIEKMKLKESRPIAVTLKLVASTSGN